jgi:MFS family permease
LRIFYGYWILAACFLLNLISAGCGPISFSFFVTSLEKSLLWSRTEIMTAFTIFFICTAVSAPFAGRLVHRYGGRTVIALGAAGACIGYVILSQISELWHYYVAYACIGFGVAAMGPVVSTLIISNWFIKRRGMAIGTMSMGAGTAGLAFTPLVIVYLLPNIGWSNTYWVFAAITGGLAIPLALLLIRTHPGDMGLLPDGQKTPQTDGAMEVKAHLEGLTMRAALSTQAFWLLGAAILFISTHMGVMQNQIPHLEDLGFGAGIVASVMSIVGVMSTLGTFIFGWLCDRIKVKSAALIGVTLIVISIVILITINSDSPPVLLWTYAFILGLGIGGWMPSMSLLTSSNFGLLAYGTIYGAVNTFQNTGAAVAPIFSGYIYDTSGTYLWAFIIICIIIALGVPAVLAIRRPAAYKT